MKNITTIAITAILAASPALAETLNDFLDVVERENQRARMQGIRDISIAVVVIGIIAFVIWKIKRKKK